jgi:hypothetical protein
MKVDLSFELHEAKVPPPPKPLVQETQSINYKQLSKDRSQKIAQGHKEEELPPLEDILKDEEI